MQYHICPRCHHEFYSDAKFFAHPCILEKDGDKIKDADALLARVGGIDALKTLPPDMVGTLLEGLGEKGREIAMAIGVATKDTPARKTETAPTGGDDKEVPAESITARLTATQDIVRMKGELSAKGIDAQTLNDEQTKAEYERVFGNPETAAQPAPAKTPRKRKTAAQAAAPTEA